MRRIVVATDFSPAADDALDWAIDLASSVGAEIVLVHCQLPPTYLFPGGTLPVADLVQMILERARIETEERCARVKKAGVAVRSTTRTGEPWRELGAVAGDEHADLVVVGSRGLGGVERVMMGSVADRVARTCPCPVVVVPVEKAGPVRRILVGTDFSESADGAIDAAVALARPLGASVTIVHAYEVPPEGFPAEMHSANPELLAAYARRSTRSLEDAASERRRESGVTVHTALRKGNAWEGIALAAEQLEADLVVVGTHGRSGLRRLLLGSVAERVLRTSTKPVLVVR